MKEMQKYRQNGQSDSRILPVVIHDLSSENTNTHILKDCFALGTVPVSRLHTDTAFTASNRDNLELEWQTEIAVY